MNAEDAGANLAREADESHGRTVAAERRALVQALILVLLTLWTFRDEVTKSVAQASTMTQAAHGLALPALAVMLLYCRRAELSRDLQKGSWWGAVLIILAVLAYAVTTWPFYVSYVRKLQFVTAFAGIALVVGGWRILWRCGPLLVLTGLAMPIGWNTYSTLSIRPETLTMDTALKALNLLPDMVVRLQGTELHYVHAGVQGVVGLGDAHNGLAAPLALASVYVFVTFSRVRPAWQSAILLIVAIPVVALGNLLRVLLHACLTVWSGAMPAEGLPRDVALVLSLVATYLVVAAASIVLDHLFVEEGGDSRVATTIRR
ncbi:MAG: archaeosortase/exosortase family protein [Phycisphaerales bacterium]|nr:archaeosortase/exosortase family protein [Phycisphaerales bacterium]